MYLAILLIILSAIIFYNQYDSKLTIAEKLILFIAIIAIFRAAYNYMKMINNESNKEGFTTLKRKNPKKSNNPFYNGKNDISLNSEDSSEYFNTDMDEDAMSSEKNTEEAVNTNEIINKAKVDDNAVNHIDSLLSGNGLNSVSPFADVTEEEADSIRSSFNPKIMIGSKSTKTTNSTDGFENTDDTSDVPPPRKVSPFSAKYENGDSIASNSSGSNCAYLGTKCSGWYSGFVDDGMRFKKTMAPADFKLWRDEHGYFDDKQCNWKKSLTDYNRGKWPSSYYKFPADYVESFEDMSNDSATNNVKSKEKFGNETTPTPTATPNPTPTPTASKAYTTDKKCGEYDTLEEDESGTLVVKRYTEAKKFFPGYSFVPPVYWDVPQRRRPVCYAPRPDAKKLMGVVDRGLPLNVLELNPDGSMADTEESVKLTNIGSIMPKFTYKETPYSSPYI